MPHTSNRPTRPSSAGEGSLAAWLVARGVSWQHARKFIADTNCKSCADAALYLRFQLAPLHLANSESVNEDMRKLLGCLPDTALEVIRDLDVYSAPLLGPCKVDCDPKKQSRLFFS